MKNMLKVMLSSLMVMVAAGCAFAFPDVDGDYWAAKQINELNAKGVIVGYPDGSFKGETNITRYEMAQIIARLMAKEDQYNAEQRATIDKLAGEYADELDNLGVATSPGAATLVCVTSRTSKATIPGTAVSASPLRDRSMKIPRS